MIEYLNLIIMNIEMNVTWKVEILQKMGIYSDIWYNFVFFLSAWKASSTQVLNGL